MRFKAAGLAVLLLTSCASSDTSDRPAQATTTESSTTTTAPTTTTTTSTSVVPPAAAVAATATCPAISARRDPDPDRPRYTLRVDVKPAENVVEGTLAVRFTPDAHTDRLVFRLWPNGPRASAGGANLTVLTASAGGATKFTLSQHRTLLTLPLPSTQPAGQPITADLTFRLQLPSNINDRLGHRGAVAWFASAHPLLAWQAGRGWATDPPTSAFAEATTSEAFRLDLVVIAPAADTVFANGVRQGQ